MVQIGPESQIPAHGCCTCVNDYVLCSFFVEASGGGVNTMLFKCWSTVYDVGPTFNHHGPCLLFFCEGHDSGAEAGSEEGARRLRSVESAALQINFQL